MTAKLAEVHTLYETNCMSMPAMLRKLADSIEAEDAEEHDMTTTVICAQLKESGALQIYGWGATDQMKALAILHLAAHQTAMDLS